MLILQIIQCRHNNMSTFDVDTIGLYNDQKYKHRQQLTDHKLLVYYIDLYFTANYKCMVY